MAFIYRRPHSIKDCWLVDYLKLHVYFSMAIVLSFLMKKIFVMLYTICNHWIVKVGLVRGSWLWAVTQ